MTERMENIAETPIAVTMNKPENSEAEYYELIAKRVRADSKDKVRLTSTKVLSSLIPDPGKFRSFLFAMEGTETYQDIKIIMVVNGDILAYSEKFLSRKDAERLVFGEEVRSQIINQVRDDSSKKILLTPINSLGRLIPGAEPEKVDSHLMYLLDDERYKDIRLITNSQGTRYLYSEESMSATYAGVLARAAANDPAASMAATIREESRIYPRPTNLNVFKASSFNINPAELERYAVEMVERPQYNDIKLFGLPPVPFTSILKHILAWTG